MNQLIANQRPEYDQLIQDIATYVHEYQIQQQQSFDNAYWCLCDSIACALQGLQNTACKKRLGPIVPDSQCNQGARVLGTQWVLDPAQAAYNNGLLIRWLDYNDYWGGEEWAHPSDNLGAILAVADYLSHHGHNFTVKDILQAMIKTHEIQGVFCIDNSLNRQGIDHVMFVKLASTAVVSHMLGCSFEQSCAAISLACVDGQALRTYRHAPNTGPRKSWAAGDTLRRAVQLALMAKNDEPGYPSALTAPEWGFYAVSFDDKAFHMAQPFAEHIINNNSFKLPYPTEFHAQTALEAAIKLHQQVDGRWNDIEKITIETLESGFRIINKTGPLYNPADRDHCIQYIVAIGLIYGTLEEEHYEDHIAANPLIDELRNRMDVIHNQEFTASYQDQQKRAVTNAVTVHFNNGSSTERIQIDYALGQPQRREEAQPALKKKLLSALEAHYSSEHSQYIAETIFNQSTLLTMPCQQFIDMLCQGCKETQAELLSN